MTEVSSRQRRHIPLPRKAADNVLGKQHDTVVATGGVAAHGKERLTVETERIDAQTQTALVSCNGKNAACGVTGLASGITQNGCLNYIASEHVMKGVNATKAVNKNNNSINVATGAAILIDTKKTGVIRRARHHGPGDRSMTSQPAETVSGAQMVANASHAAVGRRDCDELCGIGEKTRDREGCSSPKRGRLNANVLPARRSNRNKGRSEETPDSCGSDIQMEMHEDDVEVESNAAVGDAAHDAAELNTARGTASLGGCKSEDSKAILEKGRVLTAIHTHHEENPTRVDGGGKQKVKRKEYRRLEKCVKPSVVPVRTAVITYHLGASAAPICSVETTQPSGVPLLANDLISKTSKEEFPGFYPQSGADPDAATGKDGSNHAEEAAGRFSQTARANREADFSQDAHMRAATLTAGTGNEESETWRGSSRSRAGVAGGRLGRFSEAERAALCAALKQYAIDNDLEGGTVEAAVEHLMTAQDVSNSKLEGPRKRGGRALRFAALTRWLPQRSCASIYFYIRRSLCAHLGTKKYGPWSNEEVSTLLRMEAELRLSQPRKRFATIAAVLNRTASCVYDKWKEIRPRVIPPAPEDPLQKHVAANQRTAGTVAALGVGAVSGGLTAGGFGFNTDGEQASRSDNSSGCDPVAEGSITDATWGTPDSQWCSRERDTTGKADRSDAVQLLYHHTGRQVGAVRPPRSQQQLQLSYKERATVGGGEAAGNRVDNSHCDSNNGITLMNGHAAEVSTIERERDRVADEKACKSFSEPGAGQLERGSSHAARKDAKLRLPLSDRNQAGLTSEQMSINLNKDVSLESFCRNAGEKETGRVFAMTRFGSEEESLQLLQAIYKQTGERLPATGISWADVQKQCFPTIAVSRLRLFYTTNLVPKELAKRMGVASAEPVLLRFIIRCLDSLLNGKHQSVSLPAKSGIAFEGGVGNSGITSLFGLESARLQRSTTLTWQSDSSRFKGNAAQTCSEKDEHTEMCQLGQCIVNGTFIDHINDVDWLEVLPLCPTALPPLLFRRAVAGLPSVDNGRRRHNPESLQLAQQVLLLKERLELDRVSSSGRDAALLLRAALPREVLARAVQRELRRQRYKRMRLNQDEGCTMHSTQTFGRSDQQNREDKQHEQQQKLKVGDDGSDLERGNKLSGGTAAEGREACSCVAPLDTNIHKHKCNAEATIDALQETEEAAQEEARERELTEAERERKWRREEKTLGKTALLALLRRVGGREMRRLRRRNRKCAPLKDVFGVKCSYRSTAHLSYDIQSKWSNSSPLQSFPSCDRGRKQGGTHQTRALVSRCELSARSDDGQKLRLGLVPMLRPPHNIVREGETLSDLSSQQQHHEKYVTATPSQIAPPQADSQSDAVTGEKQNIPPPPTNSKLSRGARIHRDQRQMSMAEAGAGNVQQREESTSKTEVEVAVSEQVNRLGESDRTTTTQPREDPKYHVSGVIKKITWKPGYECEQFNEVVQCNSGVSEPVAKEHGQLGKKESVTRDTDILELEGEGSSPVVHSDLGQDAVDNESEAPRKKQTLAQVALKNGSVYDSALKTHAVTVFVDEKKVRGKRQESRKKKRKICLISDSDRTTEKGRASSRAEALALGEELSPLCHISPRGEGDTDGPDPERNTTWKSKDSTLFHSGRQMPDALGRVTVTEDAGNHSSSVRALVSEERPGCLSCKTTGSPNLLALQESGNPLVSAVVALEGHQQPRQGSDIASKKLTRQNQHPLIAGPQHPAPLELEQSETYQKQSVQGPHTTHRGQEHQSLLQTYEEERAGQLWISEGGEGVMCTDDWQREQNLYVIEQKHWKKEVEGRNLGEYKGPTPNSPGDLADQRAVMTPASDWAEAEGIRTREERSQKERKKKTEKRRSEEEKKEREKDSIEKEEGQKQKKKMQKEEDRKKKKGNHSQQTEVTSVYDGDLEIGRVAPESAKKRAEQRDAVLRADDWQGEQVMYKRNDERRKQKRGKVDEKTRKRILEVPCKAVLGAARNSCEGHAEQCEAVKDADGFQRKQVMRIEDEKKNHGNDRTLPAQKADCLASEADTKSSLENLTGQHDASICADDGQGEHAIGVGYVQICKKKMREKKGKKGIRVLERLGEAESIMAVRNDSKEPAKHNEMVVLAESWQRKHLMPVEGKMKPKEENRLSLLKGINEIACERAIGDSSQRPVELDVGVQRANYWQGEQEGGASYGGDGEEKGRITKKNQKRKHIPKERGEAEQMATRNGHEEHAEQQEAEVREDGSQGYQELATDEAEKEEEDLQLIAKRRHQATSIREFMTSGEGAVEQFEVVNGALDQEGEQILWKRAERQNMMAKMRKKKKKETTDREKSLEMHTEVGCEGGAWNISEEGTKQHEAVGHTGDWEGEQTMDSEEGIKKERRIKRKKKRSKQFSESQGGVPSEDVAPTDTEDYAERREVMVRADGWREEQDVHMIDGKKQREKHLQTTSDRPDEATSELEFWNNSGKPAEVNEGVVRSDDVQRERALYVGDGKGRKKDKERYLPIERPDGSTCEKETRNYPERAVKHQRTIVRAGDMHVEQGMIRRNHMKRRKQNQRDRDMPVHEEVACNTGTWNTCETSVYQQVAGMCAGDRQNELMRTKHNIEHKKEKRRRFLERPAEVVGHLGILGISGTSVEQKLPVTDAQDRLEQDMRMEDNVKRKEKEKRRRIVERPDELACEAGTLNRFESSVERQEAMERTDDRQGEQVMRAKDNVKRKKEKRRRILEPSPELVCSLSTQDSSETSVQKLPAGTDAEDHYRGQYTHMEGIVRRRKKEKRSQIIERPAEIACEEGALRDSVVFVKRQEATECAHVRCGERGMYTEDNIKRKKKRQKRTLERHVEVASTGEFPYSFKKYVKQHEEVIREGNCQEGQDVRRGDNGQRKVKKEKNSVRDLEGSDKQRCGRNKRNHSESSPEQHEATVRAKEWQKSKDVRTEVNIVRKKKKHRRLQVSEGPDEVAETQTE